MTPAGFLRKFVELNFLGLSKDYTFEVFESPQNIERWHFYEPSVMPHGIPEFLCMNFNVPLFLITSHETLWIIVSTTKLLAPKSLLMICLLAIDNYKIIL